MKNFLLLSAIFCSFCSWSQEQNDWDKKASFIFTPEIMLGKTMDSNDGFPETKLQKQLFLNFGRSQENNPAEWAQRLKGPKTGIGLGFTDFGNIDSLGIALTVLPFIEFKAFKSQRLKVLAGMGASYFSEKFNSVDNPNNKAVTTDLTWAFRLYLYYQFLSTNNIDWRVGAGYSHHSNGHTRLLNQGYNSFLVSLSADIKNPFKKPQQELDTLKPEFQNSRYSYFSLRSGYGKNVLALAFNDKRDVYTISLEYGRVYNNTIKLGIGLFYRYYEHYYDYIKGNESLVNDGREFDDFKQNPLYNASNIGITVHGEILMNHFGIDLQMGYNIFKPGYKIEWRINEGWDNTPKEIPENWQLGEYNSKFNLKSAISSRLGLKYYVIGTSKAPKNNLYLGAHLNANLGQADFTELSLGYVHNFNFKNQK